MFVPDDEVPPEMLAALDVQFVVEVLGRGYSPPPNPWVCMIFNTKATPILHVDVLDMEVPEDHERVPLPRRR